MDAYEASRIVFSRIQSLDPENASRIMGVLLIQDHGEKEMIRLAFSPESLVHSVVLRVRKELGLSTSPPTPSTPPSPSPFFSIPNPSSAPDELLSPTCYSAAASLPFYDVMNELQLQDHLSFLNDESPPLARKTPDFYSPQPDLSPGSGGWGGSEHRRSCSVSDACLGSDDPASGFGWKPCLYYARGYCKNGSSCRFLHGDPDGGVAVGSPTKIEMMEHELLRFKSAQQQRLAAASQLMASAFPYSPKTISLLLQQNDTHRAAAALLSGEDLQKLGRSRMERSDFFGVNPASRQIYLTFPADSTFREEDVSNYFSTYGPVQDVRIPYQQKRMFGFVTFVYPDTVKLILAKGNPHFVCDARVLVKPYKEKAKVLDHKKQQQMERGDFSPPCGTPTGLDSRDLYDLPSPGGGANMFYNNAQEMLWRRKLEEQALEMQSRRLMNLQLLDVKKHHHHRALSAGSPNLSPSLFSPHHPVHPEAGVVPPDQPSQRNGDEVNDNTKEADNNGQESSEHNLPDSPFASPTKAAAADYFSSAEKDATNSNLDMASFKSFNCQIPRFSSGHGVIGMFAGTGGSTFPVGI